MKSYNSTMLIDDDTVNTYLSKRLLEKFLITNGIQVVPNGEEALKFIVNYDPDFNSCPELIFLDIDMPVMNGFEFLETFNDLEYLNKDKVRIVMLTNSNNPEDEKKCRELGVKHFLNKPLTEEKVVELLNDLEQEDEIEENR